jgi:nicotinate phosphoribosyltransferase
MKIENGYERLPRNYTLMTDEYEYTMSRGYLNNNKENEIATFDIFFRKVPNNGGYAIMAGVDKIISYINNLKFGEKELNYFRKNGYPEEFIDYLRNFKFTGTIKAIPDGTPVFPNEPLVTITAPIIEAQILETSLLSLVNGAMEHATGARRIVEAAPNGVGVMEFGSRRADGCEAAIDASLYGMMAGCVGTSNVIAADMVNVRAKGTIAHSWIESFDSELEAFIAYATTYPENALLLVDTFDTIKSGIPNAIKTFEYMRDNGYDISHIGIRIDSGDLAYLSKEARRMLDEAGFPQATICLSNGLTAETIETLINQGACFNSLGVGDNISKPEGRMGCVYKEVAITKDGIEIPKIKLSEDAVKIVNPGIKKLYRAYNSKTNKAIADIMCNKDEELTTDKLWIYSTTNDINNKLIEDFYLVPLQQTIYLNGNLVYEDKTLEETKKYCNEQMSSIDSEIKRNYMPHTYKVSGTRKYVDFKNDLIEEHRRLTLKV